MPIKPQLAWEQTHDEVLLHVTLQGCKRDIVDVFVSDVFVKVNAAPTYLLTLDLLHPIDPAASSHTFATRDGGSDAAHATTTTATVTSHEHQAAAQQQQPQHDDAASTTTTTTSSSLPQLLLHIKLRKRECGVVWQALCIEHTALSKAERLARRSAAVDAAQLQYNARLQQRAQQRDAERRRLTSEQWQLEKEQRRVIEERVAAEKAEAEAELYAWEDKAARQHTHLGDEHDDKEAAATRNNDNDNDNDDVGRRSPHDGNNSSSNGDKTRATQAPAVRQVDTVCVPIEFTPQTHAMPTRARGDEEHYRKSRYKPVSIEDSPMFWKERGDAHYRAGAWADAADAYSQSIKRDGVFLTCVANRAACHLRRGAWAAAVEDCTLALTMLANTPASEVTQSRYRHLMAKLHARRGAALCWWGECARGVDDLRVAAAYTDAQDAGGEVAASVTADVQLVEALLQQQQEQEQEQEEEEEQHEDSDTTDKARDTTTTTARARRAQQQQQQREEAATMTQAAALYHRAAYAEAALLYTALLERNPRHAHAHANLAATLLHLGRFHAALEHCTWLMQYCAEAAEALTMARAGGGGGAGGDDDDDDEVTDSDDEDGGGGEDDAARAVVSRQQRRRAREQQRRLASQLLSERSTHVYLLLKAYVRGAAALCGLRDYRKAHTYLEHAIRITPYDNDLLDDCNRLAEKIRMDALVAASTAKTTTTTAAAAPTTTPAQPVPAAC